MTPCDEELQHLVNLMAEPYREPWRAYAWAKANALAASDPENYRDLPKRLATAMKPPSSD